MSFDLRLSGLTTPSVALRHLRVQATIAVLGLGEAVAALLRARVGLVDEIRQMDRELKAISIASPAC